MGRSNTPISTLFDLMKRYYGISHKELASIILSGRPLSDGRSPASRVDDRTWISRFVVHARPDSLQPELFGDFSVGALRIIARMKSQRKGAFTGSQIFQFACGEGARAMAAALEETGQPTAPYRALLERLAADGSLTMDERAEAAMVLMVSAACTADVERAVGEVRAFAQSMHGNGLGTPPSTVLVARGGAEATAASDEEAGGAAGAAADPADVGRGGGSERAVPWLGLLRLENGLVMGEVHWIAPEGAGAVVGSLAAGGDDVCAVAADVSGRHARIWRDESGSWRVEDLGSRNGTALTSALTGERCEVAAGCAVAVQPGDQLHMGTATTFALIEGLPE